MTTKIFWKIFASALFLAYAVYHLIPFRTTPFETYIQDRATAKQAEFKEVLKEAAERVTISNDAAVPDDKKSKTLYSAVRDIGAGKGKSGAPVDLCAFFPDISVVADPNIPRRNNYLLQELLLQSQGKLKLGLDLQGGISFTLRVDPKNFEAKAADIEAAQKRIQRELTKGLVRPDAPDLTAAQKADAQTKWTAALAKVAEQAKAEATENAKAAESRLKEGLDRAIEVMQGRVNGLGVAEPVIRVIGNDSIEIQLPGADAANNPDAIEKLKKPAKLEFRMVHRYLVPAPTELEHSFRSLQEEPGNPNSAFKIYEVLFQRHEIKARELADYPGKKAGDINETRLYIEKEAAASGNIVQKATPFSEQGIIWQTSIKFTSVGERKFEEITGNIAKKNNELLDLAKRNGTSREAPELYGRMAIVLDGQLVLAPGLKKQNGDRYQAIGGGAASIDQSSQKDAADLANVLNNPLEFPLELLDSKQIGSTLAEDAQYKSAIAAAVGIGVIFVFMLLYYLGAGVIACFGLALNTVLMLGVMAVFGATITLPGVAALVLTIAMAVDANILVFERVREELATGKPLRAAVQSGYDRAQATILDANLTTLMASLILVFLGTGPIKGFGVILSIGIVTTVFTCLITCRGLQEFCVARGFFTRFFGVNFFKGHTNYQFLDYAKPAFIIAFVITALGIGNLFYQGADAFSKDFKGGEAAIVKVAQGKPQLDTTEIINIVNKAGVHDVTAAYQAALGGSQEVTLRLETELSAHAKLEPGAAPLVDFTQVNKAVEAVRAAHPDHFPQGDLESIVIGRESVGGAVSGNLKTNAIVSVLLALLGVAIYVGLRFETGMGLGALVSSLHDLLLTAGLFIIVGKQFSMAMIAALLMVVSYSINDTIVVFDRIREEMSLHPGLSLREIIHLGINRTLARTILTSLSTILSAVALWLLGAGDVTEYGLIFIFGIIAGTFSTIYIASPVFYWWHKGQRGSVEKAEEKKRYEWEAGSETKPRKVIEQALVPALPAPGDE